MALWSRFFGSAGSQAVGVAFGVAAVPSLLPAAQFLENEAWSLHPDKPPDAIILSQGVAQGQVDPASAAEWAKQQGFGDAQWAALVDVANVGPALGYAYSAWRRGLLSDGEFDTALKRTGLEEQWFAAMRGLKGDRLDLGAISTAVHRGIMQDAGLLVTPVPGGGGNVPRIPVSGLDTLAEYAAHGIDPERARVLVADTGLPLSLGEMLRLLNLGKVTETDVQVSIAESNVRNEYMDVALDLRRRLLTPHEYEEAALRGILTKAEADAGAALSGMEQPDADLLFQIMGRPLNVHQITQGLAHGETLGGTYDDVPEPYRDAIRRSNIRPEYAKLAYSTRYTYPSAFVLRTLTQSGDLTEQQAEAILTFEGWDPALAKTVAAKWAEPAGAKADPWIGKADTQLWTATHKAYVGGGIDAAAATERFDLIGVAPAAQADVLARWDSEKAL